MKFWVVAMAASLAAGGAVAKEQHKRHKHREHRETRAEAPPPQRSPDGSWSIESKTSVGNCPSLIPASITIAEGKIGDATGSKIAAWGYVDEAGTIVGRFTGEGNHVARFHGTLKGGKGSGAWSSSTDMCGGTWKAAQQ